jgi:CHASE2 domain-containing sensor protein/tRNA A-37 threonylcarbamoyl transferase component Bud32
MLRKYSAFILCLLISLLVLVLYTNDFSPLARLEWKIQDMLYAFRGQDNVSSDIVLVNIDDRTLDQFGPWPWHRDKIADLLAAVGGGEPKVVLLDLLFDNDIREDTSGYTSILAGQMSWIKNVILPYEIMPAEFRSAKISTPKYFWNSSVQVNNELGILDEKATLLAEKVFLPPEQLIPYASGLGFKYNVYDNDRTVRREPLVAYFEGYYYPSAPLIASAKYLGVPLSSIVVHGGEYIMMGSVKIPTDDRGELLINFNKPKQSFAEVSGVDILNESYNTAALAGKLVIISVTAERLTDYYKTPVSANLSSTEKTANAIENIVHANFVRRMDSSRGVDMLILFGLGIIFAFVLPRVGMMYRAIILVACFFLLANIDFILFNSLKILIKPLYLGLELFLLLLASPFLDNELLSKLGSLRIGFDSGSSSSKFEQPESPEDYTFSSGRPTSKRTIYGRPRTGTVTSEATDSGSPVEQRTDYETIVTGAKAPKAASEELGRTELWTPSTGMAPDEHSDSRAEREPFRDSYNIAPDHPGESIESGTSASVADDSAELGSDKVQLTNLGRYKVISELGKGAMGKVYKGVDPAINRYVALKTIRLDFVNDPQEMAELKERLFREAQAAGKLSHPNIVTIYDVGSEARLQYIAMEYLEGQTLENMIRRKVKFNFRIIAQIISQICSALEYAHTQGIVHRDIKPANIMVLNDYRVKVMDFGIARVDTSSMTRTGIAMGTPNYIAPELLQGKPVDRRCDIFSLGVVMYEMLLHRRPFRGENLTALIYSIVNSDPEPPSSLDKSIPHIFDRIISKALQKNPAERYQNASEISASLADFIDSFSGRRPGVI